MNYLMIIASGALLASSACSKGKSEAGGASDTLREVSGTVDGIGFTAQLPSNLEVANDSSPSEAGWDVPGEPYSQPSFRFSVGPEFPKTAADGLAWFDPSKTNEIVKSELAGGRYTLIRKTKTFVVVETLVPAGSKSLQCHGTVTNKDGITGADKLGAWFEKICATAKPR